MSDFDYVFSSPISICELVFLILSSIFHTKAEIQSLLVVWFNIWYERGVGIKHRACINELDPCVGLFQTTGSLLHLEVY